MSTYAKLLCALLLAAAFAAPAAATNWVQVDRWDWIDTDSVVRSGNISAYISAHGTASPTTTGDSGHRYGVDCATRREYWERSGQLVAVPDDEDPDYDGYMSVSDPRFRLICPNASSSTAPVKPALAPLKPAPAKSTAKSDITACKTYTTDSKARIAVCTHIIDSSNPGIADLVAAYRVRCATRFLAHEKVDDALADCTRAVTLDPKDFDSIEMRGNVNSLAGRVDAAIADLTQAIAMKPKYIIPYGNRADAYLRKKDLQKAIADYTTERSLIADQKGAEANFRVHMCWARVALNVELETALSDCESAVRLEPSAYMYEMRALVRLRMGNLKDARADADKALTFDAKNSHALYTRALVNAREGKTMVSYDDFAAAQKANERVAKRYNEIGLKLMVQAENAPFCPALTALIKAAGERAASKAKANVAMPGATYCMAIDRGYWCTWETGVALAPVRQKAMATAAGACLAGYTRKDGAGAAGPAATFTLAKTTVVLGTIYAAKTDSIDAVGVAVTIAK